MHTETQTHTISHNEAANSFFQFVTIALIGVFTLAETLNFVAGVVA